VKLALPKPFFVLAPMDDVTDTVFRQVITSTAPPDLFFTEFVNVDGLQSPGREKLLPKLRFSTKERPIVAQIWGKNPENFYKTAKELVDMGFDGIDINFGCPDKTVIKNGCCIAMINNRELAGEIIQATQEGNQQASHKKFHIIDDRLLYETINSGEGVGEQQGRAMQSLSSLPLSVKTRLGLNEIDYSWHEFLLKHKLNMLSIHGRTAKQLSNVPADWRAIEHVRKLRDKLSPTTLIVGNGDVLDRQQGEQLAIKYKLDGIMIGRGVLNNPFAFAKGICKAQPCCKAEPCNNWGHWGKDRRIALYRKHVELFAKTWTGGERKPHTLNKFCKIYIQGFDGVKELREQLMNAKNTDELLNMLS